VVGEAVQFDQGVPLRQVDVPDAGGAPDPLPVVADAAGKPVRPFDALPVQALER